MQIRISSLSGREIHPDVEIAERKGLGHPDTMCDALAEQFSVQLSKYYLERFGRILHHNVDKALLRGGSARAQFGGGEVLEPIELYLAGRAVTQVGDVVVPVEEIAIEHSRAWLRENLRALDVERHVRVHCMLRPGSVDLGKLFGRRADEKPLANDTSIGVGYAPLSRLERLVLELERQLNAPAFRDCYPSGGEDVKVMGVRSGTRIDLTVARAFIDRHVAGFDEYLAQRAELESEARRIASGYWGEVDVHVNAADGPEPGSIYLTVTGTSAEAGDDGEVGRGNRSNGLITPYRPMSLEATAGKNPISHVGKLYNVMAREIAESVVLELDSIEAAACVLLSRIGRPVAEPEMVDLRIATVEDRPWEGLRARLEQIVGDQLLDLGEMTERLLRGEVQLF